MEPIVRTPQPPQRPTRPVMDIQPRRPLTPVTRQTPTAPTATTAAPQPVPIATQQEIPQQAVAPAPEPTFNEADQPVNQPEVTPAVAEETLPKKVKAPIAAIVMAVLVGGALIGLSIFAYLKTQDDQTLADNAANNAAQVQPEEIDESIKAIDEELKTLNDSTDFNETDLADPTLGL